MKQYVLFSIKDEKFAIDVHKVYRITNKEKSPVSKLYNSPEYIKGTIKIDRATIPVIDLNSFLTGEDNSHNSEHLLVAIVNDDMIALLVDNVIEVISVSEKNISDIRVNNEVIDSMKIIELKKQDITLINIEKLFSEDKDKNEILEQINLKKTSK